MYRIPYKRRDYGYSKEDENILVVTAKNVIFSFTMIKGENFKCVLNLVKKYLKVCDVI